MVDPELYREWEEAHSLIDEGRGAELTPDYSHLDALDAEVHGLINQADECVNSVIREGAATVQELEDLADGCWRSVVGHGEELLAKLSDKAINYAVARLSEAYTHALHFGITSEDIERILMGYGDPVAGPPGTTNGGTTNGGGPTVTPCYPGECLCINPLPGSTQGYCVPSPVQDYDGSIITSLEGFNLETLQWEPLPAEDWLAACIAECPPIPVGSLGSTRAPPDVYPPPIGIISGTSPNPLGLPIGTIISGTQPPPTPTPTPSPTPTPTPTPTPSPVGGTITSGGYPNPAPGQPCAPQVCYPSGYPPTLTGDKPLPVTDVPSDKPPSQPDTPLDKATKPIDIATVVGAQPLSTFCDFILNVRDEFSAIGDALRNNTEAVADRIIHLAGGSSALPTAAIDRFIKSSVDAWTNFFTGGVVSHYINALKAINVYDIDKYLSLMVVKHYFDWLESVGYSGDYGLGTDGVKNISSGGVFREIIGYHEEMSFRGHEFIDIKGELKPFFGPLRELLDYCIHYTASTDIPGIPDTIEAYLHGRITEEDARCLIKLKNGVYSEWKNVIESRREQLNSDEIVRLWLRGELDEPTAKQRLRDVGMLFASEVDEKLSLAKEIPPITDLVRFMTLNIYDPDILKRFNLDTEIERAGTGEGEPIDIWRKSQGITDEAFKAYWRAHWARPSPTLMNELVIRNRPGRVAKDIETTIDDYRQVLRENDVLEFWRDRMLNIVYRPLTRIDARRLYIQGSIDRNTFIEDMKDLGYRDDNANQVADFADKSRRDKIVSSKWVSAYIKGGLNRLQVTSELGSEGYTAAEITEAIAIADEGLEIDAREKCVAGWTKRYASGEIDELELRQGLTSLGLDATQVDHFVRRECKIKQSKERHETASTLCDWYSHGLITADDFSTRLVNLGYSSTDSTYVIKRCNLKIADAKAKELEKATKAAERKQKELAKQLESEKKRHDALIRMANKVAKINDTSGNLEAENVAVALQRLQTERGLSIVDAYRVALATSERLEPKGPVDIIEEIMATGAAFPELPLP